MRRAANDRCQSDDDGGEKQRERREEGRTEEGAFVSREISRELKLNSGQMCEE